MDNIKLLIYQGVITLFLLTFVIWAVGKVDTSVHSANRTLICVLSIPPDHRTPELLNKCYLDNNQ